LPRSRSMRGTARSRKNAQRTLCSSRVHISTTHRPSWPRTKSTLGADGWCLPSLVASGVCLGSPPESEDPVLDAVFVQVTLRFATLDFACVGVHSARRLARS
jgi:hypothetical protein